jgi:polysaccharide export outer membrane protein
MNPIKYTCQLTTLLVLLAALWGSAPARAGEYVIGEGDTLQISVWGEKDMSMQVKVRPDGMITLPALGEVSAAMRSPNELQKELTRKMSNLVKNPIVTVIVSEVTNNKVYVFGGGVRPGVYSLTQRTTLLQLLCQIGQQQSGSGAELAPGEKGTLQTADLENAYIVRNGETIKQNFSALFLKGKISDDVVLTPNDAIYIPAVRDRNVYVMGAVVKPKSIPYRDGLTVVEAILDAGGFTKFARQNGTVIYRKNGDAEITIPVKVKDLINDGDLRQNTRLQPGDYVIVSESLF